MSGQIDPREAAREARRRARILAERSRDGAGPPAAPGNDGSGDASERASLIADARFRRLWASGAIIALLGWVDLLVLALLTYELTGSVLLTGVGLLVRSVPRMLLGAPSGALIDHVDRRRFWMLVLWGLGLTYAALAVLAFAVDLQLWHLLTAIAVGAVFWALEFPVRRALIADVAGADRVNAAFGIDWSTDAAVSIAAPLIGGALLEFTGPEGAYAAIAGAFAAAILIAAGLRTGLHEPTTARVGGTLPVLRETFTETRIGLSFMRRRRLFVAMLIVAVAFNLVLNGFNAAFPEIAEQELRVREFLIGAFYALVGAGSVIGGLLLSHWATWAWSARLYWFGALVFMLGAIGAGFAPVYAAAAAIALAMGLGYACVFVMQASLLAAPTPAILRGRVMGVLSVMIGTGPLTGLQIGFFASELGARWGLAALALEAIALMLIAAAVFPVIVRRLPPVAAGARA